jgi:DNA-binding MarR family transcriptional regulator
VARPAIRLNQKSGTTVRPILAPRGATAAAAISLDPVIHEQVRLGIISALAVNDILSFNDLKKLLEITDGNLSVHARKLEDAGYVRCMKSFVGRQPRTEFKLTTTGRRALESYLEQMESVIRSARQERR